MKSVKSAVLLVFSAAVIIVYIMFEIVPFKKGGAGEVPPEPSREISATEASTSAGTEIKELPVYTVRFCIPDGDDISVEVEEGTCAELPEVETPGFLYWKDSEGNYADISNTSVSSDAEYTAVFGPELSVPERGWFAPEKDGLFHPEKTATRSDLSISVYELFSDKPTGETFLNDVLTNANCYKSATSLVSAGYMELSGGAFNPDVALSAEDISFTLRQLGDNYRLEKMLSEHEGDTFTRGELCIIINALLPKSERAEPAYFPDVAPQDACFEAAGTAGVVNTDWHENGGRHSEGYININGWLYCFDSDGYFIKDGTTGTLTFGPDGRYTSGNEELDAYVAGVIEEYAAAAQDRDRKLFEVYKYTRDKNLYLHGEIYELYKTGWEIEEALKMFNKNKGNCYAFAAQFWALARGLGYDAVCISGTIGNPYGENGQNPHGWVEIEFDGVMYIFDCETEAISYRQAGDFNTSFFKITYERGQGWSYVRDSSCKYAEEAEKANAERFPEEG